MDTLTDKIVRKYVEQVISQMSVKKVILYGSYVSGHANELSDIDIAVVVDEIQGNYLELSAQLFDLVRNIDVRIEPVLICEKNDKSGFLENISRTGIVLFENNTIKSAA